jgi:hypothetical protein
MTGVEWGLSESSIHPTSASVSFLFQRAPHALGQDDINFVQLVARTTPQFSAMFGSFGILAICSHPIPKSAADSSGVPQTRQMTAEQSPQISGSVTSRAQVGQ